MQDPRGILDVTGGAQANHAGVFAPRFQREKVIEGRDAIHPAQGESQLPGHVLEEILREIPIDLLHRVEDLEQGARAGLVTFHRHHDGFQAVIAFGGGYGRGRHFQALLHQGNAYTVTVLTLAFNNLFGAISQTMQLSCQFQVMPADMVV
jgi:hypothetical protein